MKKYFIILVSVLFFVSVRDVFAVPDSTPPTTPTNVTISPVSSTKMDVYWTASTDNVGVTGYDIYRCSGASCSPTVLASTTNSTIFHDTALTANAAYGYKVIARDAAANSSAATSVIRETTYLSDTLASHDFNDGTVGSLYTPYSNVTYPTDPTGSGRGKVVNVTYSPAPSQSQEGGVEYAPSTPVIHRYDQTIWMKGDAYIPSGTGNFTDSDNRKLIDFLGGGVRMTLHRRGTDLRISIVDWMNGSEQETFYDTTGIVINDNTWYTFEVKMVTNTADNVRDGILEIYMNGATTPTYRKATGLGWITEQYPGSVSSGYPAGSAFYDYFAGYQLTISGAGAYTDQRYWDNVTFSRERTSTGVSADTTAPSVSLTAPTNNSTVGGSSVSLTANASDNVAVSGVQFKLDTNTSIGSEDTSSPYGVSWNSTSALDGTHTLIAVARDSSNNYATSSPISITISNAAPDSTPPPTPVTPPQTSSGGGGSGGGGGGGSRVTTQVQTSPSLAPEIIALILANRALFMKAVTYNITLPQFILDVLNISNSVPSSSITYIRDLTLGSEGDDVRSLQTYLIQKNTGPRAGSLRASGASGYFGTLTQAALLEYQVIQGIFPATGYFGPLTRGRIGGN